MRKIVMITVTAVFCLIVVHSPLYASDQHEAEGIVKQIKSDVNRITISHGPIKGLGMDGMTMDFVVYDPAMLDEVQEGHKIGFVLEKDKSGNLVIMELEDKGMAQEDMSPGGNHSQHNHDH